MSDISFDFNRKKAIEVILYIANHISKPSFLTISKLMYLADKISLEEYGRFICGETYYAMKHGPVPTYSYDIMKNSTVSPVDGFQVLNSPQVTTHRVADVNELSESDVEILDRTLQIYGKLPTGDLIKISHDAAWEKAWESDELSNSVMIPVEEIVKTLDDSDVLLDFLINRFND